MPAPNIFTPSALSITGSPDHNCGIGDEILITKLGTALYSLHTALPLLEGGIAIPIFEGEGPESQEPSRLAHEQPCSVVRLELEFEASAFQYCLEQRSSVAILPATQTQHLAMGAHVLVPYCCCNQ